jgi:hypothetical protein
MILSIIICILSIKNKMKKNNHHPIENQVMDYCRKKIQKEEEVIKYLQDNRYILERLGYEIKKLSDISE